MADGPAREILGAWHMVTFALFATTYVLLSQGWTRNPEAPELVKSIGNLYVLFALPSFLISIWYVAFVPQFILLLPIGFLAIKGAKTSHR